MTHDQPSREASSGAPPPPPIRSRAIRWRTGPAPASGTASPTPRAGRQRRHRRPRLRPLPPLRRGRGPDGRSGAERLPLQRRLGPGPARGSGRVNPKGLDFYQRLVDALLERGIQPMVTLYHWDLPAALHDRGGWLNPDSPAWFADYAQVLFRALDDRVPLWVTLNEPWVVTVPGYLEGELAPGHRDLFEAPRVAHHLLLAHAEAVAAYRATGPPPDRSGGQPGAPAPRLADARGPGRRRAARRLHQPLVSGPALAGRLPDGACRRSSDRPGPSSRTPIWRAFALARRTAIFIGVNYYSRGLVRADPERPAARSRSGSVQRTRPAPPWAGRSIRKDSPRPCCGSKSATAIRRSTSPRTARPSTTRRRWTARFRTPIGSTICAHTCAPPAQAHRPRASI